MDYYDLNDFDKSIDECKLILESDKQNEWALEHLIKIYRKSNDWSKATEYLIKLHKIKNIDNPNEIGRYKIQEGRKLLKLEEFSHSRELFEEALNIDENLYRAYLYIGKVIKYIQNHRLLILLILIM